jgi:hypothetical protein
LISRLHLLFYTNSTMKILIKLFIVTLLSCSTFAEFDLRNDEGVEILLYQQQITQKLNQIANDDGDEEDDADVNGVEFEETKISNQDIPRDAEKKKILKKKFIIEQLKEHLSGAEPFNIHQEGSYKNNRAQEKLEQTTDDPNTDELDEFQNMMDVFEIQDGVRTIVYRASVDDRKFVLITNEEVTPHEYYIGFRGERECDEDANKDPGSGICPRCARAHPESDDKSDLTKKHSSHQLFYKPGDKTQVYKFNSYRTFKLTDSITDEILDKFLASILCEDEELLVVTYVNGKSEFEKKEHFTYIDFKKQRNKHNSRISKRRRRHN